MIKFRQKEFAEHDAMRQLYLELSRNRDRYPVDIIDTSSLIPVLSGNNVIIERFVISKPLFGKAKYRMYLKMGAKVKMPDAVRLPERSFRKNIGRLAFGASTGGGNKGNNNNNRGNNQQKQYSLGISARYEPSIDLSYESSELLGNTVRYDKSSRELVLEFNTVREAILSLEYLPFGLQYKVFLLDTSK